MEVLRSLGAKKGQACKMSAVFCLKRLAFLACQMDRPTGNAMSSFACVPGAHFQRVGFKGGSGNGGNPGRGLFGTGNRKIEVSPSKVSAEKVSAAKVSAAKVSPAKVSPAKVSPVKVSAAKVSAAKVSPPKVSAAKVSAAKVSPAKVSPSKVSAAKVSTLFKRC
jgi:hypothetical protein